MDERKNNSVPQGSVGGQAIEQRATQRQAAGQQTADRQAAQRNSGRQQRASQQNVTQQQQVPSQRQQMPRQDITQQQRAPQRGTAGQQRMSRQAQHQQPSHASHAQKPSSKQKKSTGKKKLIIILVIILLLILAAGAYFFLFQRSSSAAAANLDEAIGIIEEADSVVIAVDEAISQEVTQDTVEDLKKLSEDIPDTISSLKTAESLAQDAQSALRKQEDKELAAAVLNSASGRIEMLTQGKSLLEEDIKVMESTQLITDALDKASQADTKMREALNYAAQSSTIQQAKDLDQEAVDLLQEAVSNLEEAEELEPDAQLDSISNYLEAKLASAQLAVEADTAFADKDADKVAELNEQYAAKDAEVVELAKLIPEDPLEPIYQAYEDSVSPMRTAYVNARNKATEADSFLREYLGVATTQQDSSSSNAQDAEEEGDSTVADSLHGFEVSDLSA